MYKMNSHLPLESSSKDVDNSDGVHADLEGSEALDDAAALLAKTSAAFGGLTIPGRGNVTSWRVMRPVQSAPGSLLTHLIFVGVLQASRHLASRVCRWRAGVETMSEESSSD